MITLEEAQRLLWNNSKENEIEEVDIYKSRGRILAEDILSPIDSPPFDKSPLDGYAVKSESLNKVTKESPVALKIIDKVFAGEVSYKEVKVGEAIRIMTGAKIPSGADCIVKQEDTEVISNNEVLVKVKHKAFDNYIYRGEDFKVGTKVVNKNTLINSNILTAIASLGYGKIKVYKKTRVGIICTGDEIQEPGEDLKDGKIYNSNKVFLYTRLLELGAEPILYDIAKDSREEIIKAVSKAEKECDLIISTGGVSVGEKDIVRTTIESIGFKTIFWKINMKPGSPMFAARKGNVLYIGLSGTPVAAATTFELTVRRVLSKMSNCDELDIKYYSGILQEDFLKKSNKRRFLRVKITEDLINNVYINSIYQSPGQINTMIGSNGLLEVKANTFLNKGDLIQFIKC